MRFIVILFIVMGSIAFSTFWVYSDNNKKPALIAGGSGDTMYFKFDSTVIIKDTIYQYRLAILKDIDSAYMYSVKIDSLEREQFKLLVSGEDENYVKLSYNHMQGKINTYEYKLVDIMADAHSYLHYPFDGDSIWLWMMKGKTNRIEDEQFPNDNIYYNPWTVDKSLVIDSL